MSSFFDGGFSTCHRHLGWVFSVWVLFIFLFFFSLSSSGGMGNRVL
jgi:hypothetical protein